MHAISYVRFSTPDQAKGDSYRRQIQQSEDYCKRKGLTLLEDGVYFDRGVSAFRGKNKTTGQLAQLLADVQAGHVPKGTRLIVESLDRLGRDGVVSQLGFFIELLREGLCVVTLGHGETEYDERSDFTALITAFVVMSRANEESALKSHRLKNAWEAKRREIEKLPLTSIVPNWLEKRGARILPVPERVAIVQEVFQDALNGMGRRAIASKLNARNEPIWSSAKRNKSGLWRDSYVAKILRNRAVIGECQPHVKKDGKREPVGEPIADYFPPIVSEEVFHAVQEKVASRAHRGGRGVHRANNLFSGKLKCLCCGGSLSFQHKGKGRKSSGSKWVTCERRLLGTGTCLSPHIRYELVEAAILREMVQIDWSLLLGNQPESKLFASEEIAAVESRAKDTAKKIENLLNVLADGIASPALVAKLEQMEAKLKETKEEIAALRKDARARIQKKRMADESASAMNEFLKLAENSETRLKLKRHVNDLLERAYLRQNESGLDFALLFQGGGFSYKSPTVGFRYEKDKEELAPLIETVMSGDAENLFKWEPQLVE